MKEIFQEKADLREPREKRVDSSLSYPTYGRGLEPDPALNTYMINKHLCHDGNSPSKRRDNDQKDGDEFILSDRQKGQRPKIISPRR